MPDSKAQHDSTALTDGPFGRFPDDSDAIRAQIETLNAITAYYTAATKQITPPGHVISAKQAEKAMRGRAGDILRKINEGVPVTPAEKFAVGGVIYPTKVEMIATSNGPIAAITFAWSTEAHHLGRNEAMELRDQLSGFLFESTKKAPGCES